MISPWFRNIELILCTIVIDILLSISTTVMNCFRQCFWLLASLECNHENLTRIRQNIDLIVFTTVIIIFLACITDSDKQYLGLCSWLLLNDYPWICNHDPTGNSMLFVWFQSISIDTEMYSVLALVINSDKQYLAHCFRLLASLDYNGNLARNQQGTLDKIVEVVQEVTVN